MNKVRKNKDYSPILAIEEVFNENHWSTEQLEDEEIVAIIPGHWDDFALHVIWNESLGMLYFVCFSEIRFSAPYPNDLVSLMVSTNQRSWFGHFDILDSGVICFRYTLQVPGPEYIAEGYFKDIIHIVLNEFEQFYPAFASLYNKESVSTKDVDLLALEVAGSA